MTVKIITGNILKVVHNIERVDCVVTSPPYYKQRDYGHPDQLGQERTVQEYVFNLVRVFNLIKKRMPDTGTLFLNLGDKYLSGHFGWSPLAGGTGTCRQWMGSEERCDLASESNHARVSEEQVH